ncbi:MAG TPA: LnmK family bifunctional acyltransferase/decarboxylase, partial [Xanthobacteraceae bacterium]|nr:LnmK family bifunctional acyltransferase/decarboxylase [Xanthobacteraceae bacterium]
MTDDKDLTSPQIPYWLVCLGLVVIGIAATIWGGPWEPVRDIARVLGPGIFTAGILGSLLALFFQHEFVRDRSRRQSLSPPQLAASASLPSHDSAAQVAAMISREFPAFTSSDMNTPFARLGIDSISMLTIRTQAETLAGKGLDQDQWDDIDTPADLARALGEVSPRLLSTDVPTTTGERRTYLLNMPQMAVGGLSESWLFKELGDIHWTVLAKALGQPTRLLSDSAGDRIYATFTRIQLRSSCALGDYKENERIDIDSSMSRHGAGLYFSEAMANGATGSIQARLMSSFSKFGATGSNTSLFKGLPELPPDCGIPALPDVPEFARDYQGRRAETLAPPIFECEYEIMPSHDINGVGLLYFAAYPMI